MRRTLSAAIALSFAASMLLAACGGPDLTVRMVLDEEGAQIATAKSAMAKAAAALPADAASIPRPASLQPAPQFEYGKLDANVMFVRTEHVSDRAARLDMHFLGNYRYGSEWLAALDEGDPATARDQKQLDADGTQLRNRLRRVVSVAYAVLIRLDRFEPASLVGNNTFTGGTASFGAFMVDLKSGEIVAGCKIDATADRTVQYQYGPDEKQEDIDKRILANAEGTLMKNAIDNLQACLIEQTGGTFKLT